MKMNQPLLFKITHNMAAAKKEQQSPEGAVRQHNIPYMKHKEV